MIEWKPLTISDLILLASVFFGGVAIVWRLGARLEFIAGQFETMKMMLQTLLDRSLK